MAIVVDMSGTTFPSPVSGEGNTRGEGETTSEFGVNLLTVGWASFD